MLCRVWTALTASTTSSETVGRPIVVATHPRSGTHLTIDLLRKQFETCKSWVWPWETLHHLYLDLDRLSTQHPHPLTVDEAIRLMQRPARPTLKTHSEPGFREHPSEARRTISRLLDRGDILYVVRDGRDVMCSAYLWKQDVGLDCTLQEFLRQDANGVSRVCQWANHVESWSRHNNVNVVRFEDIINRPRLVIEWLGDILSLTPLYTEPYLPDKKSGTGRLNDYWRRLRGDYESTAIEGRPDESPPPTWQEAFTESDRRFFWSEAGHILKEFGYEKGKCWIESD